MVITAKLAGVLGPVNSITNTTFLRVRYSETDQMGTFYNSRALEWFECGRTELLRSMDVPYSYLESRGVYLPLVEAQVEFLGRARYDDHLEITTSFAFEGRARLRCVVEIKHVANGAAVARGYTIHAFTNQEGKVMRPPGWFLTAVNDTLARLNIPK